MFLDKTIEIEEILGDMLVTREEASKNLKASVNYDDSINYLGYIDIYSNFKEVTYRGKRIRVED